MRKIKVYIILLLLIGSTNIGKAYTNVPTLVHLNYHAQDDSLGFNLVSELTRIMYSEILSGKIALWDSPKKNVRITGSSLKKLEEETGTFFSRANNVFFNEIWSHKGRNTKYTIMGISFINEKTNPKKKTIEKLNFGYVDMRDAYTFLSITQIKCNVNGPDKLTFTQALDSRTYHFNLVQFGKNNFKKSAQESLKIKKKAFGPKAIIEGIYHIPNTKKLTMVMVKNSERPSNAANVFIEGFETFFNKNREEFFNIGGAEYYNYLNYKSGLKITRVELNEVWEKKGEKITKNFISVTFFINNKKMRPLTSKQINDYNLLFIFKNPMDLIIEKNYSYEIFKLNNNFIEEENEYKYKEAIDKYLWSQISRYVKYYE